MSRGLWREVDGRWCYEAVACEEVAARVSSKDSTSRHRESVKSTCSILSDPMTDKASGGPTHE